MPHDDPDAVFAPAWRDLAAVLAAADRRPVIDRRGRPSETLDPPPPRPGDCLVHLGLMDGRWSIAIAGALAVDEGAVVWAMCPGWLARDAGRLLCLRGLWADRGGQLYLDDFHPPRVVTWFANHLTRPDTYGARADGEPLEEGLTCPQSSSVEISRFVACKVTTRLLAVAAGVRVPPSLAITSVPPAGVLGASTDAVRVVDGAPILALADVDERAAAISVPLREAIERWPAWVSRVVVKPSGPMHLMTRGVEILARGDLAGIARAAAELLSGRGGAPFAPGDSVLVDAFVGGEARTLRVRALVARIGDDGAVAQALLCTLAPSDRPISGLTGWPQSVRAALENAGCREPAVIERFEAQLRRAAEATLLAVIRAEPRVATKPGARTELLGLDFIVALPGDVAAGAPPLDPCLIEVNNHDCTDLAHIYGYTRDPFGSPRRGSPSAGLLHHSLRAAADRSQRARLAGKRVLLIGGANVSKRCVWEAARGLGVRLVLVSHEPPPAALGLGEEVAATIVAPAMAGPRDAASEAVLAASIVDEVRSRELSIDGVLTVWEDDVVLAARVAAGLERRGHAVAAATAAKSKLATTAALLAPLSDPLDCALPNPASLAIRSVPIASLDDLDDDAARNLGFPAVLRTSCGSSAVGTRVVGDREEARQVAATLLGMTRSPEAGEARYPGCGFAFGPDINRVLLSEFIAGSEHDVDLLLFDGAIVDAWVTDNGPTDLPCCAESCALMPSALSEERQEQLVAAAFLACQRLGLRDGVVNVEFRLAATGPKLVEINARMAGFYVPAHSREVWQVDLPAAAMMIACDIRPVGRVRRQPRCHLASVQLFAEDPGARAPVGPGALRVDLGEHPTDALFPEPVANLGFRGATLEAAVTAAVAALRSATPARAERLAERLRELGRPSTPSQDAPPGAHRAREP